MSQFYYNTTRVSESLYNSAEDHWTFNKWVGLSREETKAPQNFRGFKLSVYTKQSRRTDHRYGSPKVLARVFNALQRVEAMRGRPNNDGLDRDSGCNIFYPIACR